MKWQEVLEDKSLQDLPYKIELNRWGQIVMSHAKSRHGSYQAMIVRLLERLKPEGHIITEGPLDTSDNTKVPDVMWLTPERYERVKHEDVFSIAAEICIEVLSPSNSMPEMSRKKELYFERGALEVWMCDGHGAMTFFGPLGELKASGLVPNFPLWIVV